jgi:hypothetical protein
MGAPGAHAPAGDASEYAVAAPRPGLALVPPAPGTYRVRVGAGALSPALTLGAGSSVQRVYAAPLDYGAPLLPA